MPFIRTSVHKDTPAEQRKAIVDGIHHLQYVVGEGHAAALVAEYATLTNFRPAGSSRHRATDRRPGGRARSGWAPAR